MTNRYFSLLSAIGILVIAINWFMETDDASEEALAPGSNEPDMYMLNAELTQFNDEGDIDHKITATRFTHYPESDITTMETPHITLNRPGMPWEIESEKGRILPRQNEDQDAVELWQGVTLVRSSPSADRFLSIKTENLTVVPDRKYAETDEEVIIDENGSKTSAAGMQAYLDSGTFLFFSDPSVDGLQRVQTVLFPPENP